MKSKVTTSRRNFIRATTATGIAAGVKSLSAAQSRISEPSEPKVQAYHALGNTGMSISDISMGTSNLRLGQESLVHHALDRGINYFDSAGGYTRGQSEQTLGNALQGIRDEVYLVSKVVSRPDSSFEWLMNELDDSLRRLKTDHVDVFMCHAVNEIERLNSPEWLKFIDKAKEQGKILFSGMSGHAGYLAQCLEFAIDQSITDVVLVAYNFGEDPAFYEQFTRGRDFVATQQELPGLLVKAKEKNIGITVMKTLRGGRLNDMRPYETEGGTFAQAAFRWVLSNPNVDAVVVTMTNPEQIDEYLVASGADRMASSDADLLFDYMALNNENYCRPACNDCVSSCPYDVDIPEVLRTRMYAVDYKQIEFARDEYATIEDNAAACLSCSGQPCANACTYNVRINEVCGPTHSLLV